MTQISQIFVKNVLVSLPRARITENVARRGMLFGSHFTAYDFICGIGTTR